MGRLNSIPLKQNKKKTHTAKYGCNLYTQISFAAKGGTVEIRDKMHQ